MEKSVAPLEKEMGEIDRQIAGLNKDTATLEAEIAGLKRMLSELVEISPEDSVENLLNKGREKYECLSAQNEEIAQKIGNEQKNIRKKSELENKTLPALETGIETLKAAIGQLGNTMASL